MREGPSDDTIVAVMAAAVCVLALVFGMWVSLAVAGVVLFIALMLMWNDRH